MYFDVYGATMPYNSKSCSFWYTYTSTNIHSVIYVYRQARANKRLVSIEHFSGTFHRWRRQRRRDHSWNFPHKITPEVQKPLENYVMFTSTDADVHKYSYSQTHPHTRLKHLYTRTWMSLQKGYSRQCLIHAAAKT